MKYTTLGNYQQADNLWADVLAGDLLYTAGLDAQGYTYDDTRALVKEYVHPICIQ